MFYFLLIPLLALCVGSGDVSNSISPLVGGRVLSLRKALIISSCFLLAGLVFEGWKISSAVGGELVSRQAELFASGVPAAVAGLVAVSVSMLFLSLGFPISTTQMLVASILGVGLAAKYELRATKLWGWIFCPVMSFLLAFFVSHVQWAVTRRVKNPFSLQRALGFLLIVAAVCTAYVNGANDGGAIVGMASLLVRRELAILLVAVSTLLGAIFLSRRVIATVSTGITTLDPFTSFSAQIAASFSSWLFIQFRLPVSLTQALVSAVVGAGLSKGMIAVDLRKVSRIVLVWLISPLIVFLLSSVLFGLLSP